MFSFLQHVLSLAILYLYPSYRSYKALDNKNIEDAQEWLCYWIVTGILTIPLLVSNSVLNWFPFYYEIKLIFCIWLILPQTKGHLELFNKYVIPYMDRFSGRIDNYARDITDMSKKYAGVAWKKGLEIAQTKFFEVLAKGPSALFDFSNIQLNFNTKQQNTDNGRIREITDDDELSEDYTENSYQKKRGPKESDQKQMILQKKRSTSNSNIKKFGLNRSNAVNNTKNMKSKRSMENEFEVMNRRNLNRTPSFRRNAANKRNSANSPYSRFDDDDYDEFDNNHYDNSEKSTRSNNSLYMSMMSNHRPGPGGMMGINDVYSSESDHSNSNTNSNDSNYFIDEEIEEPYNYNKNNVYYGTDQRKRISKVNQRSTRDNYYDYDYDLTREDDDTVDVDDVYHDNRRINPKMANENNKPDMNYQQGFFSNFNSIFH